MSKVLVVIDVQNDDFPGGAFPLFDADATLDNVERAIRRANDAGIPVVLVQHVVNGSPAPFFAAGTRGAEIHPRVRAAAPSAPVVVKEHADAFLKTTLEEILASYGATKLLVAGMMTQQCVTHTAISRAAEEYDVSVLPDCTTTVSEMIHVLALHALSARVRLEPSSEAIAPVAPRDAATLAAG